MRDKELWKVLLTTPLPPRIEEKISQRKLTNLEQRRLDAVLWKAIEEDNVDEAEQALQEGARVSITKSRKPPISYAFEHGQVEMATMLFRRGAMSDAVDGKDYGLFYYAVQNQSADLAELLLAQGYVVEGIRQHIYTLLNSSTLVRWWLDKGFRLKFETPESRRHYYDAQKIPEWLHIWTTIAVKHIQTPLFDRLAERLQAESPGVFEDEHWISRLDMHFHDMIKRDRVEDFQLFLQKGWIPHLKTLELNRTFDPRMGGYRNDGVVSMFWLAVRGRAFRLMRFLMASPEIARIVHDEVRQYPEPLLSTLRLDRVLLEEVQSLTGLNVFGQFGEKQETLLHRQPHQLSRPFLEWAVRHHPDWVFQTNQEGHTFFEALKDTPYGPRWEALATKLRLKREVGKSSRKKASTAITKKRL